MSALRHYLLPILAGICIGTSYIPFPPWAIFFAQVPLLWFWWRCTRWQEVVIGGLLTQFILNLIGFHWISYTAVEFAHVPWPVGILVLLLFAITNHLYYPLSGLLWWWLLRRFKLGRGPAFLLFPALFALLELYVPIMFNWHFGYTWLWAGWPAIQIADVIGFLGLNYITLVCNALLALALHSEMKVRIALVALAITMLAAVNWLGTGRAERWHGGDAEINFLVAQANIGNSEKLQAEKGTGGYQAEIVKRFIQLTEDGLREHPETQAIISPQTAFPNYLDPDWQTRPEPARLLNFVREQHRPLFTGAYAQDPPIQGQPDRTYNGFFLVDENGHTAKPYHKTMLLAFGEYYPGARWFPQILKWFRVAEFTRGQGPMTITWNGIQFGPQICYEGLYPWFSAGLADQGSEIILNVTNDSWFGKTFEPHQHLYMTLARALEMRRPLLRSTNTGISTAILADGTILQKSPIGAVWKGMFTIPYRHDPPATFYQKYHAHFLTLLAIWAAALLWLGSRGANRERSARTGLATDPRKA